MEIRVAVQTISVRLKCDKCKTGVMMYDLDEPVRMTHPPRYSHSCDRCRNETWISGEKYPRIEYEEIGPIMDGVAAFG